MVDVPSLRVLLAALVGWLDQREHDALAYLIAENRILSSVGAGCGCAMTTGVGWPCAGTGWDVTGCARSHRSEVDVWEATRQAGRGGAREGTENARYATRETTLLLLMGGKDR